MYELYEAEWCPHSHRVRQRLTELGVPYIARPVAAEPADREELHRRTGGNEIPALLLGDGTAINGSADAIIAYLDDHHSERADVQRHREREVDHAGG
jgi:glutathione S-transferase